MAAFEYNAPNNIMTPFYLSMAVIAYTRSVVFNWVNEKETFQRELQNIMGISFATYFIGWLIYFLLNAFYVCLIILIILKFAVLMPFSDSIVFA